MKIRSLILVFLLALLTLTVGCSDGLTREEKLEDFDHLFTVIVENYPFLEVNQRMARVNWESNYNVYRGRITETETDEQFFDVLSEILRDLNNGHTHMLDARTVEEFRNIYYYGLQDEDWSREYWQILNLETLNNALAVERYGLEPITTIGISQKESAKDEIKPIANAQVFDIKGKVGMIFIPGMIPPYLMEIDEELIKDYLQTAKDYQTLIIDIRGNSGGSSAYWSHFLVPQLISRNYVSESYLFLKDGDAVKEILEYLREYNPDSELIEIENLALEELPNLPPEIETFSYYRHNELLIEPAEDSIGFTGNIYLLVDRWDYSASEAFAVFARQSGFATIIGGRTGGDGIGTDPWIEMLPNSGYLFRFSWMLGTGADGTVNEEHKTVPDVLVSPLQRIPNHPLADPCVKKVLEIEGIY